MIVICPKCQFENNAETAKVVCARCATLIDASNTPETAPASHWGTTELPPRVTRPMSNLPASAMPNGALRRDPYATRIEPEADEVLDIPRVSNGVYPIAESGAVFDEVLTAPSAQPVVPATESRPVTSHANDFPSAAGFDALPEDEPLQFAPAPAVVMPFPQRDDDPLLIEPEPQPALSADWPEMPMQNETWASNGAAETNHSDWPMLPEDSFAAQNNADNPMFSSGGNRRLLVPVLLAILVFASLSFAAWYFLGDKVSKKDQLAKDEKAASGLAVKPGASAAPSIAPSGSPAVKPGASVETKAAASPTTAPSARPQTSPEPARAGSETAKPSPSVAAKKTDVTSQTVQSGPSGPSVNRNEGSLTLQFGSYNNQNEATQRVSTLKSAGVDARVVKAEIPGKGTWYRVQAGRFTSREEASRYAAQLKARGAIREFMVTGYQAN